MASGYQLEAVFIYIEIGIRDIELAVSVLNPAALTAHEQSKLLGAAHLYKRLGDNYAGVYHIAGD